MNIVNAYAKISELSDRKLELQGKLHAELEQINQLGIKLEEHTSKVREYDPYKADLLLDNFNKWKENKITTLKVESEFAIFKLEKQMQMLQTGVVYTNDINALEEGYKIEKHKLDEQENVEVRSAIERKHVRNLDTNEQRYYFLTQQYENLKNELIKEKIQLKNKYKEQLSKTNDRTQRRHLLDKYRADKTAIMQQHFKRVDLLNDELKQARIIVQTNLPSQRKLVLLQAYLTKARIAKNEYLKSIQTFRNQNKRAQKTYRSTISKLQVEFNQDPHKQRVAAIQRYYQLQIKRQNGSNLSTYHKLLAQIHAITKKYLSDKRDLNRTYSDYKREWKSENLQRNVKLRNYRKQYALAVKSIRNSYAKHKKVAIDNKSNANVLKHLKTQYVNQISSAKRQYVHNVENTKPIFMKNFTPSFRSLFKAYQLAIRGVRAKISSNTKSGNEKIRKIISAQNIAIARINKEHEDKFHRTPASIRHRDHSVSKVRSNYLHLLGLSRNQFHNSISNCKKTIHESERSQITLRKEFKTNFAHLKSKYQKQVEDLNLEIKKSKLPTEHDLQKIDDLKTKYATGVKQIHTQYFEQHELSNKNIKIIRNKTRQELKHVATDKKHASAVSFAFESRYINANRRQKSLLAAKLLRQNIKKIQNNDKLNKHALNVLTQKHIDFRSSQHVTHIKELGTHYDSKKLYGKFIALIRAIRKSSAAKLLVLHKKHTSAMKNISNLIRLANIKIITKHSEIDRKIRLVIVDKNAHIKIFNKDKKVLRVEHNRTVKAKFAAFVSAKNDAIKSNNYQEAKRLRAQWRFDKQLLTKELAQKIDQVNAHVTHVSHEAKNQIIQLHKHFDVWCNNEKSLIKSYHHKLNVERSNNQTLVRDLKTQRNSELREEIKKYRLARQTIAKAKQDFNHKTAAIKKQHRDKILAEARTYALARKTLINNATRDHNAEAKQAHDHYHNSIVSINRECESKLAKLHEERKARMDLYTNRAVLLKNKSAKAISDIKDSLAKLHKDTIINLRELERNYHHLLKNLNTRVEKDRQAREISIHTQMQRYKTLKEKYHGTANLLNSRLEKQLTLNSQILHEERHKITAYTKMYHEKAKLLQSNYLSQINNIHANHYSASVSPRVQHLQKVALTREQLKLSLKANAEKHLMAKEKYNLAIANQKEIFDRDIANMRAELPRLEQRRVMSHRDALSKLQSKYNHEIEDLKTSLERKKHSLLRLKAKDKTKYRDELHVTLNQYAIRYDQLCSKYYKERAVLKNNHKFWMNPHKLIRIDFNYRRDILTRRYIELVNKAKIKYNVNMKIAHEKRAFITPAQKYRMHVIELKATYDAAKLRAKKQLDAVINYYNNQYKNEHTNYKNKYRHLMEQKKTEQVQVLRFEYKNNKYIKYRAASVAIKHAYEVYNDKVAQARQTYISALRGYKQSEIIRLRNEHAMPLFERLYANIIRGQKHLVDAEVARLEIMKEDKKLRKVFTNLPLWVSTYIKFAFVVSALWVFVFIIFQLLYFLVGGDAFSMFSWTDGTSHLSIFGMTSVIALVITVTLTVSAFVLYILECKSKRHVESKVRLENIQTLEKTNQQLNKEYKKLYQLSREAQIQNSDLAEKIYVNTKNSFQNQLDHKVNTLKNDNHLFNKHLNKQFIHHNKYIVKAKDIQIAQQDVFYAKNMDKHVRSFNANLQAQASEANAVLLSKQHEFRHKIGQLVSLQQQEINFKQAEIQALEVAQQRETNKYKQAIRDLVNLQNQELHLKQIEYSKNLATNRKRIEDVLRTNKNIYSRNRHLVSEISRLRKEVVQAKARANSLAARASVGEKIEKLKGPDKQKARIVAREQKRAYRRMLKQKRINARMAKKQARKAQKNKKD